jgi:type VI protein secretion system component VasK
MRQDLRGQSWAGTFQDVIAVLPGLVSDRLELLVLALHRAGRSLMQVMVLALTAAILCTTAWLALCSGLGLTLVAQGLPWPLALLAVLLVNLLLAWAAVSRMRRLLPNLGLPDTHPSAPVAAASPDLDAQIADLERRRVAREAWLGTAAASLTQRAQVALTPPPWVLPVAGVGAVLWLSWRWWHHKIDSAPARPQER